MPNTSRTFRTLQLVAQLLNSILVVLSLLGILGVLTIIHRFLLNILAILGALGVPGFDAGFIVPRFEPMMIPVFLAFGLLFAANLFSFAAGKEADSRRALCIINAALVPWFILDWAGFVGMSLDAVEFATLALIGVTGGVSLLALLVLGPSRAMEESAAVC